LTAATTFARLKIQKGFVKLSSLLLLSLTASLAFAQQAHQDENSTQWSPVTLAGEFLEHDYVNWFAYADGVYDTYAPISTNGQTTNGGSFGWTLGGGVNVNHEFRDGQLSLSYRGDYRDYASSSYSTGTDQNLGVSYVKRLARRWTLSTSLGAGISFYGGTFSSNSPNSTNILVNNPFASETKYLSAGASISYQQSRRLSYVASGSYFLQRYNYPGSIGAEGVSGSGSVFYRATARTTVGATYSHSYYTFQRGVGTTNGDTIQASLSRIFPNHWTASVSAGVTFSRISGTSVLPAGLFFSNVGPGVYLVQHFNESTSFPSFSGTVGRGFRRSNFYATAGQGLSAGNGYYLASKALYLNALYSIALTKRQNVGLSGGYNRLSSVSNTVSTQFSSSSLTAFYAVNLLRHFGLNARYDYVHYGSLSPYPSVNDNRLSFGVNFSSRSVPLTLF